MSGETGQALVDLTSFGRNRLVLEKLGLFWKTWLLLENHGQLITKEYIFFCKFYILCIFLYAKILLGWLVGFC
jgi:hypothetical protein